MDLRTREFCRNSRSVPYAKDQAPKAAKKAQFLPAQKPKLKKTGTACHRPCLSMAGTGEQPIFRCAVLDNEHTNRVLLILAFVLALLVFMDFQARRHYQSQLGFGAGSTEALEAARERSSEVARSLQSPIRATADAILGRNRSIISDGVEAVEREMYPKAQSPRKTIHKKLKEILKENPKNNAEPLPQNLIEPTPQFIYLYYIQFRQGRSELVRVRRRINRPRLSYSDVLRLLQKGPQLREHGLINAFGKGIKIYGIYPEGDRLIVDLGKGMGSMGRHVIRDRLDQLALTLTQFSKYKKIELWIDGQPVRFLGRDKLPLPKLLAAPKRKVKDYGETS